MEFLLSFFDEFTNFSRHALSENFSVKKLAIFYFYEPLILQIFCDN
jgi:hypothetical protein